MSSNGMRRRSRPVPRPDGAVPHRGPVPGHQLPVHGRLRGPRVLLGRDCHIACRAQGKKKIKLTVTIVFVGYRDCCRTDG